MSLLTLLKAGGLPTVPTTGPRGSSIIDPFPGEDGDPGANWTAGIPATGWTDKCPVVSNQLYDSGNWDSMYWNVGSWVTEEVWGKLTALGDIRLFARIVNPGTASAGYYMLLVDSTQWTLSVLVPGGTLVVLDGVSSTPLFTVGDYAALCTVGDTIEVWRCAAGGTSWVLVTTVSDHTILSVGYIGVMFSDGSGACGFDGFGGGHVSFSIAPTTAGMIVRVKPPKQPPVPGAVTTEVGPNELVAALAAATAGDTLVVTGNQDLETGPGGGKQIDFHKRITIQNAPGQRAKINGRVVWHEDAADSEILGGTDPRVGIIIDATLGPAGPASVTIGAANVVLNGYELYNGHTNIGVNTIGIDDDTWGHGIDADISYGLIHDIGPMPPENHSHGLYLSAQQAYGTDLEIYDCADRAVQFRSGSGCYLERVFFYDCGEGVMYSNDTEEDTISDLAYGVDNWLVRSIGINNQITVRSLIEEYLLQRIPRCGVEGYFWNTDERNPIHYDVLNVDVDGVKVIAAYMSSGYGPWWLYDLDVLPEITLNVAFGYNPGDPDLVYTEIPETDNRFLEFTVTQGRNMELDEAEIGQAFVSIFNQDRAVDPGYPSSVYYPNVVPCVPAQILITISGQTYSVFTGDVDDWSPEWTGLSNTVALKILDAFDAVGGDEGVQFSASRPSELTGARLNSILDAISWPEDARVIDTGQSLLKAKEYELADAKGALLEVAKWEKGYLFVDTLGNFTFHERHRRLKPPFTTSALTLSNVPDSEDHPFVDAQITYRKDRIKNYVAITVDEVTTIRQSEASRLKYRLRTYTEDSDLANSNEIVDQCDWVLDRFKDAILRVESVTIAPQMDPVLWQYALGLGFGQKITIKIQPPGPAGVQTYYCVIEGVSHSYSRDNGWLTTWRLSPADIYAYWILNTSQLGIDTRLGA